MQRTCIGRDQIGSGAGWTPQKSFRKLKQHGLQHSCDPKWAAASANRAERPSKVRWTFDSEEPAGAQARFLHLIGKLKHHGLQHSCDPKWAAASANRAERPSKVRWTFDSEEPAGAQARFLHLIGKLKHHGLQHSCDPKRAAASANRKPNPLSRIACFCVFFESSSKLGFLLRRKNPATSLRGFLLDVGPVGFEPTTPCL